MSELLSTSCYIGKCYIIVFFFSSDSGHSTLRDSNENDYDTTEAFLNDAETMQRVLAEKRRRSKAFQQPLVEVRIDLIVLCRINFL